MPKKPEQDGTEAVLDILKKLKETVATGGTKAPKPTPTRRRTDGRASRRELISAAISILAKYSHPITIRQLYYRMVAAHIISNNLREYKRLDTAMTAARKERLIRPDAFADPTRRTLAGHGFLNLANYLEQFRDGYQRDPWQDQDNEVWVLIEKEALASVFEGPCSEMQVPLVICRGYPSITAVYEMARRMSYYATLRHLHILYFGDHDPSGLDIDRNIGNEIDFWHSRNVLIGRTMKRIALTSDQIEEHALPPMPEKIGDSRTAKFVEEHGENSSVELDALDPEILEEMVRAEIGYLIDWDVWEDSQRKEDAEVKRLHKLIDGAKGK